MTDPRDVQHLENCRLAGELAVRVAKMDRFEIFAALEESVKLQSHYAELLNLYDGGGRLGFKDAEDWLERLRAVQTGKGISDTKARRGE